MSDPRLPKPHPEIIRLEAAATRHSTPCGDGQVVWHTWGSGPPLVLMHGGTGSWMHWIKNIDVLSQHFSVWAPDLPAMGESDYPDQRFRVHMAPEDADISEEVANGKPPAPLNMATYAEIMGQGLEQLFPSQQLTLAGFSFGGMVSANIAARFPGKIDRLFLVGSAGLAHGGRQAARTAMKSWRHITDPDELYAAQRENLLIHMLKNEKSADELAVNVQTFNALRSRVRRVPRKLTLLSALAKARPKLRCIWGRHDQVAAGRIDEIPTIMREFDPGARVHIVEDAGHWVAYERADEVNRVMLEMLLADAQKVLA